MHCGDADADRNVGRGVLRQRRYPASRDFYFLDRLASAHRDINSGNSFQDSTHLSRHHAPAGCKQRVRAQSFSPTLRAIFKVEWTAFGFGAGFYGEPPSTRTGGGSPLVIEGCDFEMGRFFAGARYHQNAALRLGLRACGTCEPNVTYRAHFPSHIARSWTRTGMAGSDRGRPATTTAIVHSYSDQPNDPAKSGWHVRTERHWCAMARSDRPCPRS